MEYANIMNSGEKGIRLNTLPGVYDENLREIRVLIEFDSAVYPLGIS